MVQPGGTPRARHEVGEPQPIVVGETENLLGSTSKVVVCGEKMTVEQQFDADVADGAGSSSIDTPMFELRPNRLAVLDEPVAAVKGGVGCVMHVDAGCQCRIGGRTGQLESSDRGEVGQGGPEQVAVAIDHRVVAAETMPLEAVVGDVDMPDEVHRPPV